MNAKKPPQLAFKRLQAAAGSSIWVPIGLRMILRPNRAAPKMIAAKPNLQRSVST